MRPVNSVHGRVYYLEPLGMIDRRISFPYYAKESTSLIPLEERAWIRCCALENFCTCVRPT